LVIAPFILLKIPANTVGIFSFHAVRKSVATLCFDKFA